MAEAACFNAADNVLLNYCLAIGKFATYDRGYRITMRFSGETDDPAD